jgi:hypothetical protein
MRVRSFHAAREVLWALDVSMARRPEHSAVINFVRFLGGPIHMMMRRYRFVEEGLTIGKPEDNEVVQEARRNVKLWNRVDAKDESPSGQERQRYKELLLRSDELMFEGLAGFLEADGDGRCEHCSYRTSYGAETSMRFGGPELCEDCSSRWRRYLETLSERAKVAFPDIVLNPDLPTELAVESRKCEIGARTLV